MTVPAIESVLLAAHAAERAELPKAMTLGDLCDQIARWQDDFQPWAPITVRIKQPDGTAVAGLLTAATIDGDLELVLEASIEADLDVSQSTCTACGGEIAPGHTRCGAAECGGAELPK